MLTHIGCFVRDGDDVEAAEVTLKLGKQAGARDGFALRLLVVDDVEGAAMALNGLLQCEGCTTRVAIDGLERFS